MDDLTPNSDTVTFEFEKLAGSQDTATTSAFTVTDLVQDGADSGLDFAILELEGAPGDAFGVTTIEQLTPAVQHLITIIQHPARERKQVEVGHVHSFSTNTIRYNDLDTAGGSSGSGILDDRGIAEDSWAYTPTAAARRAARISAHAWIGSWPTQL